MTQINEKAAPVLAHRDDQGTGNNDVGTSHCEPAPALDSTTRTRSSQAPTVYSCLLQGEENALKAAKLAPLAGCKDGRELRLRVAEERAAGAVILSGSAGYFLPSQGDKGIRETKQFVATLYAKALNTLAASRSAQKMIRDYEAAQKWAEWPEGGNADGRC